MRMTRRRLAWAAGAAALCVAVAAVFATAHAIMLVLLVVWHAAQIAMPMTVAILAALLRGTRDDTVLALYGVAFGGLLAFVLFWIWRASPTAGALATFTSMIASGAAIAWLASRLHRDTLRHAGPLGMAVIGWAAYGLFVLAFCLAPLRFHSPMGAVQHHFGLPLPYDNVLPWLFAKQITEERILSPMTESWLNSDRPPLQTAYFLASGASLLSHSGFHYQVQSTLLQALWLPGMWLLLRSFGLARGAVFAALVAAMFSGFALIHGIFTWPKLFPVVYIALAAAILFNATRETLADPRVAAAVGACLGLAMMCHPGSLLIVPGLAGVLLAQRRFPGARFMVLAAIVAVAVMLPWMLYQKFVEPPGNRLLKWHLAGVIEVDKRSTLEAIRDAYSSMTLDAFAISRAVNVEYIVGPADSPRLTLKGSTVGVDDAEAMRLRILHFLHVVSTLGVLALAPLAWLAPWAWRRQEFRVSLLLAIACLVTIVPWVLVMFQAGGTTIHTGSLAVVCFLFAAAMLAFFAASPWLAAVALGLNAMLTFQVYARGAPLAIGGVTPADYRAFYGVAAIAFAISCVALWKSLRPALR